MEYDNNRDMYLSLGPYPRQIGGGGGYRARYHHQQGVYPVQRRPYHHPAAGIMSVPASRAQSDVFNSASQYGGPAGARKKLPINHFIVPVFVLEVVGLACLWALFYYLRYTSNFPYHHRVFHCRDTSLMYPNLKPDEFLFISRDLNHVVAFLVPIIVIFVGEIMFWIFSTKPRKKVFAHCKEFVIHLFTRRLFRFVSVFIFGYLIVAIFIDTLKLITGYQRPNFLAVCNVSYAQCTAPVDFAPHPSPHIACLNRNDELALRKAWLSFPSMHAGLSSYAMIFASCYIHYMISLRGAPLLRPFLIFGLLAWSLLCGFSRIQGYKVHWVDVWVGYLIGFLTAFYLCFNVLCFQEVYHYRAERPVAAAAAVEERISPFFSWFRLPRVQAPSRKDDYSAYGGDDDAVDSPPATHGRQRSHDRTYEVTTTTESFHRTVSPNNQNNNGSARY